MTSVTSGKAPATHPHERLTEHQRKAALHRDGELLISAAAGSGKTTVLSARCANLLTCESDPVSIDQLLVLTFTDAAAAQMRGRIIDALGAAIEHCKASGRKVPREWYRQQALAPRADIATLHSFCSRLLRTYFHAAKIDPLFKVCSEFEDRRLKAQALSDLLAQWHAKADADGAAFARMHDAYGRGRDDTLREMVQKVSDMLDSLPDPEVYLQNCREAGDPAHWDDAIAQLAADVAYRLRLRINRVTRDQQQAEKLNAANIAKVLADGRAMLEQAAGELETNGVAAWDQVRQYLQDWPFPKKLVAPKQLLAGYDAVKDGCYDPFKKWWNEKLLIKAETAWFALDRDGLREAMQRTQEPLGLLLRLAQEYRARALAARHAQGWANFSDLERRALEMLRAQPDIQAEVARRYRYVLVDEYQDINPLQQTMLQMLSTSGDAGGSNLYAVGDPKQGIYGFRLAAPELFVAHAQRLRKANPDAVVYLPHNFRSSPALIDSMNGIFRRLFTPRVTGIDYADGHALVAGLDALAPTDPDCLTGTPLELHLLRRGSAEAGGADASGGGDAASASDGGADVGAAADALENEARYVAYQLAQLVQQGRKVPDGKNGWRPVEWKDCAILLRSPKNSAATYARVFSECEIPLLMEQTAGFLEMPEVRQVLAVLECIDNPMQDVHLAGAMVSELFGRFTQEELAQIRLAYPQAREIPFHQAVHNMKEEALARGEATGAAGQLARRVRDFLDKLARWRTAVQASGLPEGLAQIYQEAGVLNYLAGLPAGAQRVANCRQLHAHTVAFAQQRQHGIFRFMEYLRALQEDEQSIAAPPPVFAADNAVRLMSVHKSKGLEFPVVVVAGLGKKFNLQELSQGMVLVDREFHVGLRAQNTTLDIEYESPLFSVIKATKKRTLAAEELRLLYVAMTRAQYHLILCGTMDEHFGASPPSLAPGEPLPDDMLLDATTPLDWLEPLFDTAEGAADETGPEQFATKVEDGAPPDWPPGRIATEDPPPRAFEEMRDGKVPARCPALSAAGKQVVERLTKQYPREVYTTLPALMTVSQLKGALPAPETTQEPAEAALPTYVPAEKDLPEPHWATAAATGAPAADGLARGTATHRVLQHLPFDCAGEAGLAAHLLEMRKALITAAEEALVQRQEILWFLQSSACEYLRSLPADAVILREQPFAFSLPASELPADLLRGTPIESADPMDHPLLRGVVDVLVVTPREITLFDYKTDQAQLLDARLPIYRRQMRYYALALQAIFKRPVTKATLVLLARNDLHEIPDPARAT